MMISSLKKNEIVLPIYDNSNISLKKIAVLMSVSHSELAQIAQRNVRTIERDYPSASVLSRLQPVLYVLKMLWELTDGHQPEIQRWLREPLIEWRGQSPLNCLMSDRIEAVVTLVERIYYGDSAGY